MTRKKLLGQRESKGVGVRAGYPFPSRSRKSAFYFILLINTFNGKEEKMKKILTPLLALLLTVSSLFAITSCTENKDAEGGEAVSMWDSATYKTDTEIGNGATTVLVSIEADGKAVSLTVKTDKENLGDALFELGLINDPSFFDTANGIKADWDKDNAYWAFYIGEEYQMVGVQDAVLSEGSSYRLVYTVM